METMNRRELIIKGGMMLISTSAFINTACMGLSKLSCFQQSGINNKQKSLNAKKTGIVRSITGKAYIGETSLKRGDRVPGGIMISVKNKSKLVLGLTDNSIVSINGRTNFDLNSIFKNEKLLHNVKGALPQVLNKDVSKEYAVHSNNKLTVIYRKKDLTFNLNIIV